MTFLITVLALLLRQIILRLGMMISTADLALGRDHLVAIPLKSAHGGDIVL